MIDNDPSLADGAEIPVADPHFDMFPAGQTAATYLTLNGVGCPLGSGCAFSDNATVGWTQSVTMVTRTADAGQFQIGQLPASIAFNSDPMINATTPEPIVLRAANATAYQIVSTPLVTGATYTLDVDLGFEKFDYDAASVYLIVDGHQVQATPLVNLTQFQMQKTGNWYDFQASYTATSADDHGSIEILLSSLTNGKGFGFFADVRLASAGGAVAPTISGTGSGLTTTSEVPVRPFAHATIGDANVGATDALTITLGGVGGTLADGTGFNSLTTVGAGVYTLSGTAAAITSELDALVFTSTAGAPNTSSTTTFTLSDQSSADGAPVVDTTTTVIDNDIASQVSTHGTSDILLQNGDTVADWIIQNGQYEGGNILSTAAAGWNVVGTGDFTGNGADDVLLQSGGAVADWITQNGQYESGHILSTTAAGWNVVGTGDFTGNGTDDVLLQNGGTVVDWLMKDGTYQGGNVLTTGAAGWNVVGTGDFTGNGTDDVLLQNGGTVVDWLMKDGTYQGGNVLTTGAAGWDVVGTGDFTGNGTDDVLLQNGGTVVDWIMKDGAYQSGNVLTTGAAGWNVVGTGDFTGGGTDDVLLQNGGTVVDWIMQNGKYVSGNVLTTNAAGWTVAHST